MSNPVQSMVTNLQTYLKAQIAGLAVLTEWPTPNQVLTYPSLTIFSGQPQFQPEQAYPLVITAPNGQKQVTSNVVCGQYDAHLQLDLWCRSKPEREKLLGQLVAALNPLITPMGLSLQLADYFNIWARYDMDNYQFVDDEAGVQRQELRAKFDILATCKHVQVRTDYAMEIFDQTGVTAQFTDITN